MPAWLSNVNPMYSRVLFSDGRERNVSLRDLGPFPSNESDQNMDQARADANNESSTPHDITQEHEPLAANPFELESTTDKSHVMLRRSRRSNLCVPPLRYGE